MTEQNVLHGFTLPATVANQLYATVTGDANHPASVTGFHAPEISADERRTASGMVPSMLLITEIDTEQTFAADFVRSVTPQFWPTDPFRGEVYFYPVVKRDRVIVEEYWADASKV